MVRYRRTFSRTAFPLIQQPRFLLTRETMQRAIFEIVSGFDSRGEWFRNCYRMTTDCPAASQQLDIRMRLDGPEFIMLLSCVAVAWPHAAHPAAVAPQAPALRRA